MTAGAVLAPTLAPVRLSTCNKPKRQVDTKTLIEIKCDTPNTEIYYTVNGAAPNPYSWFGFDYNTFRYCQPLLLEEGKCVVKAIAIDPVKHRESFVVTKTFYVERVEENGGDEEEKFQVEKEIEKEFEKEIEQEFEKDQDEKLEKENDENDLGNFSEVNETDEDENISEIFNSSQNSSREMNLHESNFSSEGEFIEPLSLIKSNVSQLLESLRCTKCSYSNHANPAAQYCSLCGNQLQNKMPFAVTVPCLQQMSNCSKCMCKVPQNLPYCIICETSFTPKRENIYDKFKERKMCTHCYTINSTRSNSCIMCSTKLLSKSPITISNEIPKRTLLLPTIIHTERNFAKCEDCGRMNCRESRYCDWCGKKQEKEELILECPQCNNKNQSDACYCHGCGYPLQPPVNLDLNGRLRKKTSERGISAKPRYENKSTITSSNVESKTVQTLESTSYLSQKWYRSMERVKQIQKNTAEENLRAARSISPGNGYWRQQVDHIAGHLKIIACNDTEFRSKIAKPKLKNLISASAEEGTTDFSIQLTFATHKQNNIYQNKSKPSKVNTPFEKQNNNSTQLKLPSFEPHPKKQNIKLEDPKENILKAIQSTQNSEEFKTQITKCLQDQNNSISLLSLVIQNGQSEMITHLINAGFDCNKSNVDGYPPLHEAVLLREKGLEAVKELLKCGADPEKVNRRGQTAFQLANSINNQEAVKILNNYFGRNMLDRLISSEFKKTTYEI